MLQNVDNLNEILGLLAPGFISRHVYRFYIEEPKRADTIEVFWCLIWSFFIDSLHDSLMPLFAQYEIVQCEGNPFSVFLAATLWTIGATTYVKIRESVKLKNPISLFLNSVRVFDSDLFKSFQLNENDLRSTILKPLDKSGNPIFLVRCRVTTTTGREYLGITKGVDHPSLESPAFLQLHAKYARLPGGEFSRADRIVFIKFSEIVDVAYELLESDAPATRPDNLVDLHKLYKVDRSRSVQKRRILLRRSRNIRRRLGTPDSYSNND